MGLAELVRFPCERLPDEPKQARLLGIYAQRQDGLYLQRVRVPGGRIRPEQWTGLADLMERYAPGEPLHLTTRQDVELHGLRPDGVPAVQRGVCDLGLTGAGACGDTVRNVTSCPSNGLRRGTWDVSELAASIQSRVESIPWITDLPRKFKISVCGCFDTCARPWINDLGLVANRDGTFRAIAAGSLGSKPGAGITLRETLTVGEVLPLVVALLRLFHAEGDRTRRHRARLRHVRERLGDETFKGAVERLFGEETAHNGHAGPRVWRVEQETPLQARLHLPLGDLMPEPARELGLAAREAKATLRIGLDHDLLLFGQSAIALAPELRNLTTRAPIVACPGTTWCSKGIADARAAAERIGRRLARPGCPTIAVSGCPNNCARSGAARIGLVGRMQRVENTPVQGFRVLVGGGEGCDAGLARELHPFISADDVDEAISWLVQEFRNVQDCDTAASLDCLIEREFNRLAEACRRRYGCELLAAGSKGILQ